MSVVETLREAASNLSAHKLRASLSMLGMIFGVGAVIAMLSIGDGAEREALAMVERLGVRNIVIESKDLPREELMEIRKKSPGLTHRDVEAMREAVPELEWAAPRVRIEPYRVSSPDGRVEAVAFGVSHRHFETGSLRLAAGRFLDELDESTHAQVAVVGAEVEGALFHEGSAVGRWFKLDDVWLEVVGVLESGAPGARSPREDGVGGSSAEIYLPYTTALRKLDRPPLESPFDQIVASVRPQASPWRVAADMAPLLELLHGGADDYRIVVPEALLEQSRRTQRLFKSVMGSIAGISLLVGGIGIMNIMLASVLERTREIGIRLAVGARRRDIRFQFLVESFSISLVGGLAGTLVGVAIALAVALYAGWPTVVTLWSVLLATGVSVTVGVVSGLYPASRASELDPVTALGYE